MARIVLIGMCSGTTHETSQKGNAYTVTKFTEIPSMAQFQVFGDLGLDPSYAPTEYILDGQIESITMRKPTVQVGKTVDVTAPVQTGKPTKGG